MKPRYPLFLLALLISATGFAQGRDRIYTQTDKSGYVAGETVWFKTYLLSGLVPGSLGTNLYVDLRNEAGDLVLSGKLPVFNGIASGNLDIPLSLAQGIYLLRTYTKTQPSKDAYSAAVQPLYVFNPKAVGVSAEPREPTAIFRPASGYLAAMVENLVFVALRDQLGHPVATDAEIVNSRNESVAKVKTDTRGLGSFSFVPVANEQYIARVRYADGSAHNFNLPAAEESRVVLSVTDAPGNKVYSVIIPEQLRNNSSMTIRGFMDDNPIFQKNFTAASEKVTARIPTDELPMGLLELIVTDAQQRTLARTATWVMPDSSLLPATLRIDSLSLAAGGHNVFSLVVPENTLGSFSVSVTDADKAFRSEDNTIISGLLLNQDSKNASYHSNLDITKKDELELALGTGDWADQSVHAGKTSQVIDSDYITIKGVMLNKGDRKPITKGDMSVMFTSKDSVTSFAAATLGKDGSFVLPKMIFDGRQQFRYSLNGNRWKDLELVPDTTGEAAHYDIPFTPPPVFDRSVFSSFAAGKPVTELATMLAADSISSTGLRAVTVQARRQTPLQQVNDRYSRGLFNSLVGAKVLDLITDAPIEGGNILDYLQGKIMGLMIYSSGGQYVIQTNRQLSFSLSPPPRLFLNESETSVDFIKTILVKDVALVKYFPPGMGSFPGVGIAPVLAIYTKKPGEGGNSGLAPMAVFSYSGYISSKDFETDFLRANEAVAAQRSTIYWNPNLIPQDDKPEYRIRFNNSPNAKRLRVVIEGVTLDGKLLHLERVLE